MDGGVYFDETLRAFGTLVRALHIWGPEQVQNGRLTHPEDALQPWMMASSRMETGSQQLDYHRSHCDGSLARVCRRCRLGLRAS